MSTCVLQLVWSSMPGQVWWPNTSWFLLRNTCIIKTSTSMCRSQAGRQSRRSVQALMKCVKASQGTMRTTRLWRPSSAYAFSGGLFAPRWHSRELVGLQRGHIQSARFAVSWARTVLQPERMENREKWDLQGSSRFEQERLPLCDWCGTSVSLEGKLPLLFCWNKYVAMCTPATKIIVKVKSCVGGGMTCRLPPVKGFHAISIPL